MGVMDEAVQHGIGDCRIADHLMPMIDRHLAEEQDRRAMIRRPRLRDAVPAIR